MNAQVFVGVASSLFGGALVAIITYLSTRQRTHAEARKLDAEAERTKAETNKMLSEMQALRAPRTPSHAVPSGWVIRGSDPDDYEIGTDTSVAHSGAQSGFVFSRPQPRGFATLMQTFKADNFRGERLRLTAFIKATDVEGWAGLWMRIDATDREILDNTQKRPIQGTSDWRQYHIVLDIPENSDAIAFGVLLDGKGQVWLDDCVFEVVSEDVPTTAAYLDALERTPTNLDFSQLKVAQEAH